MKKNKWFKGISLMLCVILLFSALPVAVIADDVSTFNTQDTSTPSDLGIGVDADADGGGGQDQKKEEQDSGNPLHPRTGNGTEGG